MKLIALLLVSLLLGQVIHASVEYEAGEASAAVERKPAVFVNGEYEYEGMEQVSNNVMKVTSNVMGASSGGDPRSNEVRALSVEEAPFHILTTTRFFCMCVCVFFF